MFKNSMTPRVINRPTPSRPGLIYSQRSTEYARIISTRNIQGGAR